MGMAAAGLAFSAVGALSQMRQAQAVQAQLQAQAQQQELQAKQQAIAYKQQAADTLKRLNEHLATSTATAAASGIEALSGSALALNNYAISEAANEYAMARDNELIALSMGKYKADVSRASGKAAAQAGYLGAITTLGTGYMNYTQLAPTATSQSSLVTRSLKDSAGYGILGKDPRVIA